jgi:hypothetical protein
MVDHSQHADGGLSGAPDWSRMEARYSDDGKRIDVFGKYALPGNRYKKLIGGNFMRMDQEALAEFGRSLAADAARITSDELRQLFEGDWRERLTAAWFVGMDRRSAFRETVSTLLLERRESYAGKGYCFALMRLASHADAQTLLAYLKRYLNDLELRSDQPWALGALLLLDSHLSMNLAGELFSEDGPWARWANAGREPIFEAGRMRAIMQDWRAFAERFSDDKK